MKLLVLVAMVLAAVPDVRADANPLEGREISPGETAALREFRQCVLEEDLVDVYLWLTEQTKSGESTITAAQQRVRVYIADSRCADAIAFLKRIKRTWMPKDES